MKKNFKKGKESFIFLKLSANVNFSMNKTKEDDIFDYQILIYKNWTVMNRSPENFIKNYRVSLSRCHFWMQLKRESFF